MSVQARLKRLSESIHYYKSRFIPHKYLHWNKFANSFPSYHSQFSSIESNAIQCSRLRHFSNESIPTESFSKPSDPSHTQSGRIASASQLLTRIDPASQASILQTVPQANIRNFSIIAHIDHGKSTLADRLLELSGNIDLLSKEEAQVLDNLQVERERGITVKAQTATMFYRSLINNEVYILNLIDTPGHVDFSYEVSRALAACQGVLLLVDAIQGIQAQTLANYYTAKTAGLDVIPVITKMDLPAAQPALIAEQIHNALGIDKSKILYISSKTGQNVETIFPAIIDRIKPPSGIPDSTATFRGLLFDSIFLLHRGVQILISVRDGQICKGDKISFYHQSLDNEFNNSSTSQYEVIELGVLTPKHKETEILRAGQVGYVIAGIKTSKEVKLGDTVFRVGTKKNIGKIHNFSSIRDSITPLPGFKPSKPFVFAGIFPSDSGNIENLTTAIGKLTLNDASVLVEKESSDALGSGFRCGFLGILHMDVFVSRLEQEFDVSVICTAATVPYLAKLNNETILKVDNPANFPAENEVIEYQEPFVNANIITPGEYLGAIMQLIDSNRGETVDLTELGDRTNIQCKLPLAEIVIDFYDNLKSISSGYASFDYEDEPYYTKADLVKLEIRINNNNIDALSIITNRDKSEELGRKMIVKLKETIDRQGFEIIIQAAIGKNVIARERLSPVRKDVLTKSGKTVGGGDVTRKNKLLQKQKEGKKRLKTVGTVELSQETFTTVMKLK